MAFTFSDCLLDERTREFLRDGQPMELQTLVFDLLLLLAQKRGQVTKREELERALWRDVRVGGDSLRRLVKEARRAVGDDGTRQQIIATSRGIGYRLAVPVEVVERGDSPKPRPLVGLEDLLESLESRAQGCFESGPGFLFLTGGPGAGKSRVADELRGRMERRGVRTLSLRPSMFEAPPAFSLLGALSRRLEPWLVKDEREALPNMIRSVQDRPAADPQALEIALGVASQLRACSARAPLLCVLDDLHRADLGSLAALEILLDELRGEPIVFLATSREPEFEPPAAARLLGKLLSLVEVERWAVPCLDVAQVGELVEGLVGTPQSPEITEAISRITEGNPLLVEELAREIRSSSRTNDLLAEDQLESLAQRIVQRRLAPLDVATRRALCVASALGDQVDLDLMAMVEQVPLEKARAQLSEAIDAGLLEGSSEPAGELRFLGSLFRSALYDELQNLGGAEALHRRIGEALILKHGDAPAAELARHFLLAGDTEAKHLGVGYARLAGERARNLAAWSEAASLFRLAAEAAPADEAAELLTLTAEAEVRCEGIETARATFRRAIEASVGASAGHRARAALGFADRPSQTGTADPAVRRVLSIALDQGPSDPGLRIQLQSRLAAELRYDEPRQAMRQVEEAAQEAEGLGDPAVLGRVLDDQSFVQFPPENPSRWLALNEAILRAGRRAGSPEIQLAGLKGRITEFMELGDLDSVEQELRACEEIGEHLRSPYARWLVASVRTTLAFIRGDFDEARELAERAAREGRRTQSPDVLVQTGAHAFYLAMEEGNLAALEPAVLDFRERFPGMAAWKAAHARLMVETGRTDEAAAVIEELAHNSFECVRRDRGWLLALAVAGEVAALCNRADLAEACFRALLPFRDLCVVIGSATLFYGSVELWLGRLATVRGRFEHASDHLDRALATHERLNARPWVAHTLAARAELALALGDDASARRERRGALALAKTLSLVRLTERLAR